MALPKLTDEQAQGLARQYVLEMWGVGWLEYKLKACQREMLHAILACKRFKYFIKCARRLGKSYLLTSLAIMVCLQKKGAQVRYAAPTQKQLRKIIHPLIKKILADCPEHLRPVWKGADGLYLFPNGSELHLAGVNNNHADDLRGTACDLFIVDEAGTVDDLHYLIHDVAMPQFLDPDGDVVAGRRLVVASSPPRSPAHEFTAMAAEAEVEGNYSHFDIFAGEYPEAVIRLFLEEDGVPASDIEALLSGNLQAVKSTTIKREYLALDVVDENSALCPEWETGAKAWDFVPEVQAEPKMKFWLRYDALDVGVADLSVDLLAHYDFERATLFVWDEVAMNGPQMTTELLAEGIRAMETKNFGVKWESKVEPGNRVRWAMTPPDKHFRIRRISDVDLLLVQDMGRLHGLPFEATDKGSLDEMVNQVRIWVRSGRIVVHPRCKQLLGCLKYGVWNERRDKFAKAKAFGHFDAFAALMYLVRNVDTRTNPVPEGFGRPEDEYFYDKKPAQQRDKIKKLFNIGQRR